MSVGTVKAAINRVKPGGVTFAEEDVVVKAAVQGGLKSSTLRTAESFFETGPMSDKVRRGGEALIEDLYMGLPRDIASAGSGQKFTQSVSRRAAGMPIGLWDGTHPLPEWRAPGATRIHGAAKKDYPLQFSVAGSTLSVPVKKGWTPQQTAQAMAQAVNHAHQKIVDGAKQYTKARQGGDMVLTGVHATATNGVLSVKITVSS